MTDPSVPLSVSITSIATALGMGILVGAIRERHSTGPLAGLRTHAIVALLGVVTFGLGLGPYIAALAAVGALAVVGYVRNAPTDLGLTGETALLLNMALAGLAVRDPQLAAGLGVVAAMLLQAKAQLQNISRNIVTEQELKDALLILAALLVVMPLLPHHAVDPWGVLDPRTVWMIVVLVMAMGMLGHVAMRMAGVRWWLAVTGFFSGFASSTAATASFGQRVKTEPRLMMAASSAAILSNLASLLLLLAVVWAAAPGLMQALAWPMAAAVGVLVLNAAFGLRAAARAQQWVEEPTAKAFKLAHAFLVAAVIAGFSVLAAWLRSTFGDTVAIAAAMLAALTELQAAAVGIAQMGTSGSMSPVYAQWGVLCVLASSAVSKSVLAFVSGGRRYGMRVAVALASMEAAALVVHGAMLAGRGAAA